ncbi:hypothetical protein FH972_024569 [Carpinus fangiana]|uniref:rRNA biogenesis protein RRP5 n=1 Tax=Carpinus fangiana TaxID=176857 RepID=A0A5N6KYD1_9ROSI|nr:hypothetical protein FH972_024569 [Carpinus fangiana]
MAPIKRKADEKSKIHGKSDDSGRPEKRPRKDDTSTKSKRESTNTADQQKTVKASTLLENENSRAFPRGGASVLTPLEQKQIQVKAAKDALFEESGHKRAKVRAHDSEQDSDLEDDFAAVEEGAKKKTKKRKTKSKDKNESEDKEPHFRVEGLKTKHLQPGCSVLGQVSRLTAQEIVLDLPNNLTGTVSITAISKQLTARVQALVDKNEDSENDTNMEKADEDVDLCKIFHQGQYLRASPVTAEDDSGKRKRIHLTIDPSVNNGKLVPGGIPVHSTVQASVVSVEDHGLIMDMGFDDKSVRGFMSSKEIPFKFTKADIQEGMVFLCVVTGLSSNGKVVKLSANHKVVGDVRKTNVLTESSTIDPLLPGTAVEVLISRVGSLVLAGQVLGSVDAGADLVHSGAGPLSIDLEKKYKAGSKITARIIYSISDEDSVKLGVSLLDHVVTLSSKRSSDKVKSELPSSLLPQSSFVDHVRIVDVAPKLGLFVDAGVKGIPGFVHVSRVADQRVEDVAKDSGAYKTGTTHRGRILGYNAMDGLYLLSLQQKILDQPFLSVDDVKVGEIVNGKVDKIIVNATGVAGIVLELAESVTGFVPHVHMADIQLAHPEKKFKQGATVKARVLSTDTERRQVYLTLKKTLLEDDSPVWSTYEDIEPLASSVGTLTKFTPQGAVLQFFGTVRGFLPKNQMSDSFVEDPTKRFRLGQSVKVQSLEVKPEDKRLIVSCRANLDEEAGQITAFSSLKIGEKVSGVITQKSGEDVTVDLHGSELRASLRIGQLTDGTDAKNAFAFKRLRISQNLDNLVILEKFDKKLALGLSSKPSLVKSEELIVKLDDLNIGQEIFCHVKSVTATAVFVNVFGGLTGLLPRTQVSDELSKLPNFGMSKDQTLKVRVLSIDLDQGRFAVTMKKETSSPQKKEPKVNGTLRSGEAVNPVDGKSTSIDDYVPGYTTKARVSSVKDTQLNVQLADNLQGRIDVSELFQSLSDIKDRKHPLRAFSVKDVIDVTVLGIHDARNHRFLPISHRAGKVPVFELSAKKGGTTVHSLDEVKAGQSYLGFVNNVSDSCLWINISPNIRGRVQLMDVSDNPAVLQDLDSSFPSGSAIISTVKSVDPANGRLDLTFIPSASTKAITLDGLAIGTSVAGRVTKVTERAVVVQLSPTVSGHIGLTELADDFESANPMIYKKNEVVRVSVVAIDHPNKRVTLSTRPSKIASSSLPIKDKLITSVNQLKVHDLIRGFVKNVADIGLFVSLGPDVTAFVRVSELSDSYLKDWKSQYEVDRLVSGKIIAIDDSSRHIQMSLKASVVSDDYVAPMTFNDMSKGQIVTGKVRKVEEYGAFIVVDNSHNVSGLCHRTEVADRKIGDVRKVLGEGDPVKAVVLEVDPEKRRISFGLKASYFGDADGSDEESGSGSEVEGGVDIDKFDSEENEAEDENDEDMADAESEDDEDSLGGIDLDVSDLKELTGPSSTTRKRSSHDDDEGLDAGGFNWDGTAQALSTATPTTDGVGEPTKKKKKRAEIKVDQTGDLDKLGPRSTSDFERLLLGQRDSSSLWVQYMAFQLDLGEVESARQIAERALREISIREQDEKLNVWVALLNLENAYGSDESLEDVFKRVCEVSEGLEMHERLASIYIDSGKLEKAHRLFLAMTSNKRFTPSLKLWTNFATFLFDTLSPPSPQTARDMLPRAMKSVPSYQHRDLITQFALLEFKRKNGDAERGRTMFAQLLDTYPGRWDLWDVYIDAEKRLGQTDNVRRLYEDMTASKKNMRRKRAQAVFKAWLMFEEEKGTKKNVEHVKAKAAEYVERQKKAKEGVDED